MDNLAKRGSEMATTVKDLAKSFQFKPDEVAKLDEVNKVVSVAAKFMESYSAIEGAVQITSLKGAVVDMIVGWFTKGSPLQALAARGDEVVSTIRTLGKSFEGFDPAPLKAIEGTVEAVAAFAGNYSKIAGSLQEVAPGLIAQFTERVLTFFGGDSPLVALAKQSKPMVDVIGTLSVNFGALAKFLNEKADPKIAGEAIAKSADIIKGFNPLAKAVQESGSLIEDLADGWIFSGPMATIKENLPAFTDSIQMITSTLNAAFSTFSEDVLARVERGIKVTDIALKGVTGMATRLSPVADILARASERSMDIQRAAPGVAKALRSILSTAVQVADVTSVKQPAAPRVAAAEIQSAVKVQLDPDTTDKPVHERLGETNALLGMVVKLLQQGTVGGRLAMAQARVGGASGPSPATTDLAGGRF
jgi:hypothetical protein